jgi:hypothetical protein
MPEHGEATELLPASIASQMASLSRERLLRRVQAGEIGGSFIHGRWMIDRASLARWIRDHRPELAPAG